MTRQGSKNCTYHLRSSKATKRQDSKPHSALSICFSSSSDNKHDTSQESHSGKFSQKISLATSLTHSLDATDGFLQNVDSSAAAHLASTLCCKSGSNTESMAKNSSNEEQRQLCRSISSDGKGCTSSSISSTSTGMPCPTQNDRQQRSNSVIPVLRLDSISAQDLASNGCNNQKEDVLNAFRTSALWSSVDHPNCGRLNESKKHYKLEYSFCKPINDSTFTSTQSLSDNHLSTITISSLDSQSNGKMTYPPPPPPEIDPAATSASYGAYPTSGNLSSGKYDSSLFFFSQ